MKAPGEGQDAVESSPRELVRTVGRLLGFMKTSKLLIAVALVAAIVGTVLQVATPKMLGDATTVLFNGATSHAMDFGALASILLGVCGLYAGSFVASFLQQRSMVAVAQRTAATLRQRLKEKMARVPISYLDGRATGDLMSVATNDVDNIAENLQEGLVMLVTSVVLFVGVFVMMLTISPLLTLLACIMVPGGLLVAKLLTGPAKRNNRYYYTHLGSLNAHVEETYQGFAVVKAFGGEGAALADFDERNENMYRTGWRARFFGGIMMPCMMLLENASYVLIAVVGAVQVVGGGMPIGNLQAFLQYSSQFSDPITKFSMVWTNVLSAVASAERVFAVLDAEEMGEADGTGALAPATLATLATDGELPKVAFRDVSFGYGDEPLMEHFDLEVSEGATVAIVGHTGAGKTTLINLLERFYDVDGGAIELDGADIASLSREEVRGRMGMVLQDPWLFTGTIYDNIAYGNPDAAPEQVRAAAKAAYADEFVRKLPHGFNTVLSEDADNISQGQRQLLTIARAFAADPEILILDEATSSVDGRTELIIQRAMAELMRGRTSFVIAHRLSTVVNADVIVVMDHGAIVEQGTHAELLARGGAYASLYESQFEQKPAAAA
ncbi:ABC transporter ATP-binding protein [Eggerthella sinensis]|uniref:Fatty acid ABC transporter ATP-binding/permease protein n=1 Tax=Eggerthella sinensis TaxID=242230 RepID=A0A3N0IZ80_9ACTN|nr:ABC transporter ATP-binding protein [Eggerthella sinensis]RDB70123.1 multidrug ABC transporter ATP-binding protein [Eggerthella sinensis]RNM42303.1 multidrug ABC transporter ATP-binding protein [Eggerthella sinensis]